MAHDTLRCPKCGAEVKAWRNPVPTVDIVIYSPDHGVVLIRRGKPPFEGAFALPGGFVETGETVEQAAKREAQEETGLEVKLEALLGVYSAPDRDPRRHTLSTVFIASVADPTKLAAGDDAAAAAWHPLQALPNALAFDHATILAHFQESLHGKRSVIKPI